MAMAPPVAPFSNPRRRTKIASGNPWQSFTAAPFEYLGHFFLEGAPAGPWESRANQRPNRMRPPPPAAPDPSTKSSRAASCAKGSAPLLCSAMGADGFRAIEHRGAEPPLREGSNSRSVARTIMRTRRGFPYPPWLFRAAALLWKTRVIQARRASRQGAFESDSGTSRDPFRTSFWPPNLTTPDLNSWLGLAFPRPSSSNQLTPETPPDSRLSLSRNRLRLPPLPLPRFRYHWYPSIQNDGTRLSSLRVSGSPDSSVISSAEKSRFPVISSAGAKPRSREISIFPLRSLRSK